MSRSIVTNCLRWQFAVLLLAAGLTGCGGGGGTGSSSSTTGSVSVLFSDAPSDEFARIDITVTDIELRGGDGGPVSIFSGSETFDLLSLTSFSQLFSVADDVPAGTYHKVRLRISDLALVRADDAGNVVEIINPPLPANGRIDVHAGRPFAVLPGGALLMEIDIDADRSIHLVQTGNGGYRFRPVIRLRILNDEDIDRLARISGIIEIPDRELHAFEICDPELMMRHGGEDSDGEGDSDTDGDGDTDHEDSDTDSDSDSDSDHRRSCVNVAVLDDTSIFNAAGDPITADMFFENVADGDPATVVGQFRFDEDDSDSDSHGDDAEIQPVADTDSDSGEEGEEDSDSGDSDGDSDSDGHGLDRLVLDAIVIQLGPEGTFASITGTIVDVAANGQFPFDADAEEGQPPVRLTVQVQESTRIFTRNAIEVGEAGIQPGLRAEVDGILMPPAVKSSLIVVEPMERMALTGTVASEVGETFDLATDEGTECVALNAASEIFVITVEQDGISVMPGDASALVMGAELVVFGEDNAATSCYDAGTIIVLAP